MKKLLILLFLLAGVALAGTSYAYSACGTGQVSTSSLTNCTIGVEDFSNWTFSAPGYTGTATVQIEQALNPLVDPFVVTLRFSAPIQGPFSLSFTATVNSPTYGNASVVQELLAGNIPNNASATGVYNGMSLKTDGLSYGDVFAQGAILPSPVLNAALTGTGSGPAPPPPCGPPGLCGGGPLQKVDINIYLVPLSGGPGGLPEPMSMALTGVGLFGLAILRRKISA